MVYYYTASVHMRGTLLSQFWKRLFFTLAEKIYDFCAHSDAREKLMIQLREITPDKT